VSLAPFRTAWCAVGGERGGEIVPRWFDVLAELGLERVHLFWAIPEASNPAAALDRLRSTSARWLAGLQAMGIEGDLSIKRGLPGPWIADLAELAPDSLIITGPPASRGARSSTIHHLLRHSRRPFLLLPDLVQPPEAPLFERPVVEASSSPDPATPRLDWLDAGRTEWLDLARLAPAAAVQDALRLAEDLDASLLVFTRRTAELVPLALQHGNFPILVPPTAAVRTDR
jgi:hypothetical protein